MGSVYFIGDLHLGHKNIMKFGQRAHFNTIDDHDVGLMENWNSVVTKQNDLVYVLGDVAMTLEAIDLLRAFNGRKVLIMGNHDTFDTQVYLKYFEKVVAFQKKYHGMVMTHIPIHPHEMRFGWQWNIHGHIHSLTQGIADPRYINVNADWINLTPISLDELRSECEARLSANPGLSEAQERNKKRVK